MSEYTLRIDGMHCGSCVRRAGQALAGAGGIEVKELRVGAARIETSEGPEAVDRAVAALGKVGYAAHIDDIGTAPAGQ